MRFAFLNNDAMPMRSMRARHAACTIAMAGLAAACTGGDGATARVTIPHGASFRTAADSLGSAGIIQMPWLFRIYARFAGHDRDIQAGTYQLPRNMAWRDAIAALNDGDGLIDKLTIPEGYSIAQITPLLVAQLNVPAESIAAAVRDSALRERVHDPAETLEGYLFPDTYMFSPGTTARRAIGDMVRRFERAWTAADDSSAATLGLTRHSVLTMASIVEKEAKVPTERPVIAGVYYNRLRRGIPLQADPTIQYALGKHVDRVFYKDLDVASPYNTYKNAGLPPGPIASPGGPSIHAALHPADVPYLYFVAAADGHHEFRTTLAEHETAIRSIKKAAKDAADANGGTPPSRGRR